MKRNIILFFNIIFCLNASDDLLKNCFFLGEFKQKVISADHNINMLSRKDTGDEIIIDYGNDFKVTIFKYISLNLEKEIVYIFDGEKSWEESVNNKKYSFGEFWAILTENNTFKLINKKN